MLIIISISFFLFQVDEKIEENNIQGKTNKKS